ncbi:MAG TPA: NUDIX domain-containing protein [Candidatus Saccharimonadales bacterium]|nr:NUDIX domain-containing protein [Candidatus Saccharimonadales bacterium]
MSKVSAGLLIFKKPDNKLKVLLVHPGGPFWTKKDSWGIPKGLAGEGEDLLASARREFAEELGVPSPAGHAIDLGEAKLSGGKILTCFAIESDFVAEYIKSNTTTIEWPPRSGKQLEIPEIDRARWFDAASAVNKMHKGQEVFIHRLADKLDLSPDKPIDAQVSLF